jgi:ADP-heptose:LPS heptosyltransferase
VRTDDGFTRRLDPRWTTFHLEARGAFVPVELPSRPEGETVLCRELEWHRQTVEQALKRTVGPEQIIPRFAAAAAGGAIVVSPFTSEPIRDCPRPLLDAAVAAARRLLPGPVLIAGQPQQETRLTALAATWRSFGQIEVRSRMSFEEYLEVIRHAGLVLTADTATAHVAVACDRPSVVFLGGGHYGQFGPWRRSRRQQWLTHHVDCFGCNWQCPHPAPYCLTRLTGPEAANAVEEVLAVR